MDERSPLRVEEKGVDSDERLEYLKSCYESNIFTRIARSREGSIFQGTLIAFLQLFIPIRIIIDNRENYEQCDLFGDMIMSWDTVIIGTSLIYLLWLTILNDTNKSMRGFEFLIGLPNIPRRW